MENLWNMFKQRTLEVQHLFHNMMVQSLNQSTHPRENNVFNDMEEQHIQQAMALSMGEINEGNVNYENDIFPPPLPSSPNEFIQQQYHQNEQQDMMQEDDEEYTLYDEEDLLRRAMQESLNDAKEKGIFKEDQKIETNERSTIENNNNNTNFNNNFGINQEDDVDDIIQQIRKDRTEQNKRKQLLREQELAYQETLLLDNQKKIEEEKKRREEEEKEEQLKLEKEMEEAILLSKELSKKKKIEKMMESIPLEPPKSDKDSVEIVVRLTDGTKVSRRFQNENKLIHLHNWITSLSSEEKNVPELFSISMSFPRKKFSDLSLTFREAGLVGSVLLFIEEEEEDEEEGNQNN